LGVSVNGKVAPETEKPAAVFTESLPNVRLAVLAVNVGTDAPNCKAKVFDTSPDVAVSVAVCGELVVATVALKLAMFTPAATVTEAGTVTAALLLDKFTAIPPLAAAAFSDTVQPSIPAPVIVPLAQPKLLTIGTPEPDKLTVRGRPSEELLASVRDPVVVPAAAGLNCTLTLAVWPGFNVIGKLAPEAANPAPEIVAALTVTGVVPVDDRVTVCAAAAPTSTLPKLMLLVLIVSSDVTAFSCKPKLSAEPSTFAVRRTVCDVLTAATVAVKLALVAPGATATNAGTATEVLSLARPTDTPLLAAGPVSVTVQASVPEPVAELLAQLSELSVVEGAAAIPVPLRPTTSELLLAALLLIVNWPVAAPVAEGLNWTAKLKVLFGLTLTGSWLWLVTEKGWPVTFICEIVTDEDP
jgi:hypothetical protein